MFEKLLPYDTAHLIMGAYLKYYHQYKRITKRAQIRFENRDWHGIQADSRERLTLYRNQVGRTTEKVLAFLGNRASDRNTWKRIKEDYLDEVINFNTRNIAETFYNSVFRHSHKGLSVDEDLMFVHATGTYREFRSTVPIYQTFFLVKPIEHVVRQLFSFYTFDAPWEDMERDIGYITTLLNKKIFEGRDSLPRNARLEMLKSIFFRNKGAYIVGRLHLEDRIFPFIMPLLHEENGIYVDAILLEYNEVSSIFSYNRSYFLVDVDIVSEMVDFLLSILPTKSMGELYNSIGFEKHGKTVLYRDFLRHMDRSFDEFVIAPGIKGMVMSVFTLNSYNMVFKVIKDRFAAPKKVTEREVKEKYEVVFFHDRVGRMADSHMFENFTFSRERISPELLDELLKEAPSKVTLEGDIVKIKHLYIEKKMIPLNLYLETASPEQAEEVINEYGKAIKQLAAVNIFPGDMLLKNFGVTRLKRVVFYDYDEIGFLTDYNFRRIPEPRDYYDELSSEPWYSVGPNDVFPEEFPRFLIGRQDIRELFYKLHGDLYDVTFWRKVQERLRAGEIFDVFPYRQRLRFKKMFRQKKNGLPEGGPKTDQ
ncbi:MAG: bifunctional isocitrate dehydrogenase kinase/phosphatase [Lewinellaceae bacterium]|nr:bifunctional isocitrate dehydrogenase kinase/phosphatase [Phaeodactylibacter sp.]MCB0612902.1 bifunctional isocitrate dehydrogenase kinase/phosphatase [Phaeodactylibacter sp.]MCB9351594.1 bifunctional isocitrate dehydrogenase kinase/phosphatase [Lewinellaceae bacterium]